MYMQEDDDCMRKMTREHLFNLVRKLELSQRKAELLTSDLKTQKMLEHDINVTIFRNRQMRFMEFFVNNETNSFVYCKNISGLMREMGMVYEADKWRLFIDSSKSSLKAVLLNFDNSLPPIPIAYAIGMKETYDTMKLILDSVRYEEHQWRMCCDLKVVALLRGLQLGWTKNACFLCDWDTRFKGNQYEVSRTPEEGEDAWKPRNEHVVGEKNIKQPALVPREKILLPPLHVKLRIMKNFGKFGLPPESAGMDYLKRVFPKISAAKLKEGRYSTCFEKKNGKQSKCII